MENVVTLSIDIPYDESPVPGYLAHPNDDADHPGVVLIQEWWGLVPHIQEVARRFAADGFFALVPDLYHGRTAAEPNEAQKLAMELDRGRAAQEIQAAIKYLASLSAVRPKKIGLIGWCMGGRLALLTAAADQSDDLGAVVAFYGHPPDPQEAARMRTPVLGLYGSGDHSIPVSAVREFEEVLEQQHVPHQIHVYKAAPHAFFNDTRTSYREAPARDAWQRTLDWFGRYVVRRD